MHASAATDGPKLTSASPSAGPSAAQSQDRPEALLQQHQEWQQVLQGHYDSLQLKRLEVRSLIDVLNNPREANARRPTAQTELREQATALRESEARAQQMRARLQSLTASIVEENAALMDHAASLPRDS